MQRNPLLARFADEPTLVSATSAQQFESLLEQAANHELFEQRDQMADASGDYWSELGRWSEVLRPYNVVDGILQIPVKGVLLHDFSYAWFGWATGYDYIERAFLRGMDDSNVRGIALVIDSPGGMVAGCFDAVDRMVARRGEKPVRAFAAEAAYSAAYAIFCVADRGIVSRTGGVGSIGVVTSHLDVSEMMEQRGYRLTFIHAGKHKVDGNPYAPLPEDVKARIQERIDSLYDIFVGSVASNRNLDEQAVRDTEALCFTASQAISNGLADEIGRLDDALAAFAADLSSPQGDEEMSNQDTSASNPAENNEGLGGIAQVDHDAAVATARTEGAATERTRIAAILDCEEATGRDGLARHLALSTDTGIDAAKGMLAASPAAAAEGEQTPFDGAMNGGNPDAGAGASDGGNAEADADGADIVALAKSTGIAGFNRNAK